MRKVLRARDGTYTTAGFSTGAGEEATKMVFADFDGNGWGDVLVGEAESLGDAPLIGFEGIAGGGLAAMPRWYVGVPISGLAADDFDGDRKPDLALVTGKTMSLHFFRNADAKWLHRPPRGVPVQPAAAPLAAGAPRVHATQVEFVMPHDGAASVSAYDITGRRVLERELGWRAAGVNSAALPELAKLRPGVYWLRAGERGAGGVRKFVVTEE